MIRLRIKSPSFLYHLNRKRRIRGIHRMRLPKRSYTVKRKLTLLRHQQYFCLPTLSQTKSFIRKQELSYYKRAAGRIFLGMEWNILNLLFRTNLFPTTKFAYALVKLGGVLVNGESVQNPRAMLRIFDSFQLHPAFIRSVFFYFMERLWRRTIRINSPTYLSCNYRLMHFVIWRAPTIRERKFTNTHPFWRGPVDLNLGPISPEDYLDPKLE